jgi:hypothetical protein
MPLDHSLAGEECPVSVTLPSEQGNRQLPSVRHGAGPAQGPETVGVHGPLEACVQIYKLHPDRLMLIFLIYQNR